MKGRKKVCAHCAPVMGGSETMQWEGRGVPVHVTQSALTKSISWEIMLARQSTFLAAPWLPFNPPSLHQ